MHQAECTVTNVADITQACKLLRGEESTSGYTWLDRFGEMKRKLSCLIA